MHDGHYRRYERPEIISKLKDAGYDPVYVHTQGWPLSTLLWWIKSWVRGRQLKQKVQADKDKALDKRVRTEGSGRVTPVEVKLYNLYGSWLGRTLFSILNLQRYFYNTDWGISFIILAKKMKRLDNYQENILDSEQSSHLW